MSATSLYYLIPFLASAVISAAVGMYAWRRRAVIGAAEFSVAALAQAFWTSAYIFELISSSLESKIFWDNLQFVSMFLTPTAFLVFTMRYTGRKISYPERLWGLLAIVPAVSLLLIYTDSRHGLIRPEAWIVASSPFSALIYDFTPAFWAMTIYVYGLTLTGILLLINKFLRPQRLYRTQIGVIIIGMLMPMVGGLLTLLGLTPEIYRDVTPLAFALNNLIVARGLFRYGLLDILPVARDVIFESMGDIVVVIDERNRIIDLNPAAQSYLDPSTRSVIGQPVDLVYAEWSDLVERFRDMEEANARIALTTKQGLRHFDFRLSSLPGRRGPSKGRMVVMRDITDMVQAEEELEARTQQLEAANQHLLILSQAKDEFVSNVSHELRTPITNLKLYLDLLSQRPEKGDSYLQVLIRETDRLENMIQGLLTLSRLDQDRLQLHLEPINLNELSEEYVDDRAAMAGSKGLELKLELSSSGPVVYADRNLLGQALSILLTNALSYTPAGGKVVVSTQEDSSDGGRWAGICVGDTGPGIPPDEHNQLFTRFFRGVVGRKSDVPGTGLGLAIVSEIVERHQGRVEVESEGISGKGATFRIWFPSDTIETD